MLSTDTREDADAAVSTLKLEFPVLHDSDTAAAKSWGVFNLLGDGVAAPALFVFDGSGGLKAFRIGRNAGDRPSAPEVLEVVRSFARAGAAAATATPGPEPTAARLSASGTGSGESNGEATATPLRAPTQSPVTPVATPTSVPAPSPVAPAPVPTVTPRPVVTATPVPVPSATPAPSPTAKPLAFSAPLSDFTLPDANTGQQVRLGQYLGKKNVVLVFYRAYW